MANPKPVYRGRKDADEKDEEEFTDILQDLLGKKRRIMGTVSSSGVKSAISARVAHKQKPDTKGKRRIKIRR